MSNVDEAWKARISRLEVDDKRPAAPRRKIPPITDAERAALRAYLDALDKADDDAEALKHEPLPSTWQRLREMIYEARQPFARRIGDEILYRAVGGRRVHPAIDYHGGVVICRTHLLELHTFRFDGKMIKVRAVTHREREAIDPPSCAMCRTHVAHGNRCYNEHCSAPLHPQWPAVYCSNACALDDL